MRQSKTSITRPSNLDICSLGTFDRIEATIRLKYLQRHLLCWLGRHGDADDATVGSASHSRLYDKNKQLNLLL